MLSRFLKQAILWLRHVGFLLFSSDSIVRDTEALQIISSLFIHFSKIASLITVQKPIKRCTNCAIDQRKSSRKTRTTYYFPWFDLPMSRRKKWIVNFINLALERKKHHFIILKISYNYMQFIAKVEEKRKDFNKVKFSVRSHFHEISIWLCVKELASVLCGIGFSLIEWQLGQMSCSVTSG